MNARLSFDAELESLSASLIRMGALATDAIDKAIEALEANGLTDTVQVLVTGCMGTCAAGPSMRSISSA